MYKHHTYSPSVHYIITSHTHTHTNTEIHTHTRKHTHKHTHTHTHNLPQRMSKSRGVSLSISTVCFKEGRRIHPSPFHPTMPSLPLLRRCFLKALRKSAD